MKKHLITAAIGLAMVTSPALADTMMQNVQVTQLGGYSSQSTHFVWFSVPAPAECSVAPKTLYFSEDPQAAPGGKSLMTVFLAALAANRKLDVRVSGCSIMEVYLK